MPRWLFTDHFLPWVLFLSFFFFSSGLTHSWDTFAFESKRRTNPEREINGIPVFRGVHVYANNLGFSSALFQPGSKFNSQLSNYVATRDLIRLQLRNLITLRYLITENWRANDWREISVITVRYFIKKYLAKEYLLIFLRYPCYKYIYLIQIFSLAKKPDQFPDARSREKVCFSDHRQDNQALLGKKNSSCVKRLTSGVDHPLADRPRRGKGAKKATASTSKGERKKKRGGREIRLSSYIRLLPGKRVSFRILQSRASIPTHAYTRRAYLPPRAWKP